MFRTLPVSDCVKYNSAEPSATIRSKTTNVRFLIIYNGKPPHFPDPLDL